MKFEIVDTKVGNTVHGGDIPNNTVFTATHYGNVCLCVKSYNGDRISIVYSNCHNSGDFFGGCRDGMCFNNYKVVNKITVEV